MTKQLNFGGLRALVFGGATSMGASVAFLAVDSGAEVTVKELFRVDNSEMGAIQLRQLVPANQRFPYFARQLSLI